MIDLAHYLLKMVACSGILFLYYHLFLRNRIFHQWNRFYLLAAVVISLILPLVSIPVYREEIQEPSATFQMLQAVGTASEYLDEVVISSRKPENSYNWPLLVYFMVSGFFFLLFLRSLIRILSLVRSHTCCLFGHIRFYNTMEPGTPFSFFRNIFWNEKIDLQTDAGQQIFEHELIHVREKHSIDKVFLQIVLVLFWINPFFWLIRRELWAIHEFIADQRSVARHGTDAFAAMVLQTVFPGKFNSLANPFFQTILKRRFHMLTKIHRPGVSYISRLAFLPVLAVTVLAFSVKTKKIFSEPSGQAPITVIIDAGHGKIQDKKSGARVDELFEDDIVLSLARKVRALNTSPSIRIFLTREGEETVSLEDRVGLAVEKKADLFISLHVNAQPETNDRKGLEITIPDENTSFSRQSQVLASLLSQEMAALYTTRSILTRKVGTYVLNKNVCPAVLMECGYMTNAEDLQFISDEKNQEAVALKILSAIQRYALLKAGRISDHQNENGAEARPATMADGSVMTVKETIQTDKDGIRKSETAGPAFTEVDKEAWVDQQEWRKFLEANLQAVIDEVAGKGASAGQYTTQIRFIVQKNGELSDFSIVKDPGYGLGGKVLNLIRNRSPRWHPAEKNGRKVNSYYTQPVTFVIAGDSENEGELEKIDQVKSMSLHELAGVEKNVEIVSLKLVRNSSEGFVELDHRGNNFNESGRQFMNQLLKDGVLILENILIRRNGKMEKQPGKIYML